MENVIGVVSLIIWTLGLLVCVEYSWLAMSLSKKGEGGTIVLREILKSLLKSKSKITLITFLSFIGISLFIGDGVITPAISILSAVEGLRYIPGLEYLKTATLVFTACLITFGLFLFQRKGVENVSQGIWSSNGALVFINSGVRIFCDYSVSIYFKGTKSILWN